MATYKVVDADQLDADMSGVADSIRAKGGTTEQLAWPDGYKAAIEAITVGSDETTETYVKDEALAVANNLTTSPGTFKMVFVTDLHNMDDVPRLEHANQAIQALCRVTDIDCVIFGGDYIRNWTEITYEDAVEDIKQCRDKFKNQIVPTLWLNGNHDTNGYVGERLTNSVVTIDYSVFAGCSKLTEVNIGSGVTKIDYSAFDLTENLEKINVNENNTKYSSVNGVLFNKLHTRLIKFPSAYSGEFDIPVGVAGINAEAFTSCHSITSVSIPASVNNIHPDAFDRCPSLKMINVDENNAWYFSVNGVLYKKNTKDLFRCPEGFEGAHVIPDGVTTICESAFRDCANLTEVHMPDSLIILETWAFIDCSKLENVIIPPNVTTINYGSFMGCENLISVRIPASVTKIGDAVFSMCLSLQFVSVDENNQYYSSDNFGVFYDKAKTTLIQFPAGFSGSFIVPSTVTFIKDRSFFACMGLTNIYIPDSVITIDDLAFSLCRRLMSVHIGSNTAKIGAQAFYQCDRLSNVFYSGSSLDWSNIDISFSNEQLTEATIHFEANNLFALYGFTSSDQNTFFDFIAHNKTDEIKDLMIFVALYDANGAMIDLNCQTMTLSADSYEAFSCKLSCNLYNYLSLDFVVRLFMTDANTLQPISDVVTHVVDIYGVGPIVKPIV